MKLTADEILTVLAALNMQLDFNSANVNVPELRALVKKLTEGSQASELAKIIAPIAVAQNGIVYLLCEDGSQVALKILPATADTQWTETVQVETYRPAE